MPKSYIRGEILPPLSRYIEAAPPAEAPLAANEDLNVVATWLDDRFVIPGTRIRFGLDSHDRVDPWHWRCACRVGLHLYRFFRLEARHCPRHFDAYGSESSHRRYPGRNSSSRRHSAHRLEGQPS